MKIADSIFGAYTPGHLERRKLAIGAPYVLVRNPRIRRGLVHIVKAATFGELARRILEGKPVKTLCAPVNARTAHGHAGTVSADWEMVPRRPDSGHLVSCAICRGALSHDRGPTSSPSD